jgi:hypothetical protein
MIFVALTLMATGVMGGLLGYKLFKVMLPLIGLIIGSTIGFVGVQSVFGAGVVSTTMAIFAAMAVGLVFGLLSFVYFRVAITVYVVTLVVTLFTYLGTSLGLSENGFVLSLLAISGGVLGFIIATEWTFGDRLIITMTSFAGSAFILAGVFLASGSISLEQLNDQGVIRSVAQTVDQSFLWVFVWLAGGLIMSQMQRATLINNMFGDQFQFDDNANKNRRK